MPCCLHVLAAPSLSTTSRYAAPHPTEGSLPCSQDNKDGSLVSQGRPSAPIVCPPGCLDAGVVKPVWGTGVYTSGSPICLAAIHAGVLTEGGGAATLYYQPGQPAYRATIAHGIASGAYGEWPASFSFEAQPPGLLPPGVKVQLLGVLFEQWVSRSSSRCTGYLNGRGMRRWLADAGWSVLLGQSLNHMYLSYLLWCK